MSTLILICNFVAREINLTDGSQTYTLVGVVNGNPKGCRAERDFPDYHTSIGNAEVCTLYTRNKLCYLTSSFDATKLYVFSIILLNCFRFYNGLRMKLDPPLSPQQQQELLGGQQDAQQLLGEQLLGGQQDPQQLLGGQLLGEQQSAQLEGQLPLP